MNPALQLARAGVSGPGRRTPRPGSAARPPAAAPPAAGRGCRPARRAAAPPSGWPSCWAAWAQARAASRTAPGSTVQIASNSRSRSGTVDCPGQLPRGQHRRVVRGVADDRPLAPHRRVLGQVHHRRAVDRVGLLGERREHHRGPGDPGQLGPALLGGAVVVLLLERRRRSSAAPPVSSTRPRSPTRARGAWTSSAAAAAGCGCRRRIAAYTDGAPGGVPVAASASATPAMATSSRMPLSRRRSTWVTSSTSCSSYRRCPLSRRLGRGKPCRDSHMRSVAGATPVRWARSPMVRELVSAGGACVGWGSGFTM